MGWYGPQGDCGCCEGDPPGGCVILDDDFDRADTSDMGSEWSEESGDWEIVGNSAKTPSSTGMLISTASRGALIDNYVVEANLKPGTRMIFDWVDEDNYHYASHVTPSSVNQVLIRKVEGGVDTNVRAYGFGGPLGSVFLRCRVCVRGDSYFLNVFNSLNILLTADGRALSPLSGLKAGLETESTGGEASHFFYTLGADSGTAVQGCNTCIAMCSTACCTEGSLPTELVLDIGGVSLSDDKCTGCSSVGGEYNLVNSSSCVWGYFEPDVECTTSSPPCFTAGNVEIRLQLTSDCLWTANIEIGDRYRGSDPECGGGSRDLIIYQAEMPDPVDCEDFELSLDRVSVLSEDNCPGTWPATITLRTP